MHVSIGLLNTDLGLIRHNEPEGSACLGALPEDGNFLRFLPSAPAHCQRLLQGDILLPPLPRGTVCGGCFNPVRSYSSAVMTPTLILSEHVVSAIRGQKNVYIAQKILFCSSSEQTGGLSS